MSTHPDHPTEGDTHTRQGEITAVLSVGCALTTLVVALRVFTRSVILKTFGADDAVMAGAQALVVGSAVAIGLEVKYGLGLHTWVQPEEDHIPYLKSFYSSIIIYNVAMCLVKISILLQYRRIFAVRTMQLLTTGGLAFFCLWTITLSVLLPLVCVPVAAFWDENVEGKCLDNLTIWYVMASVNLVTDLGIFVLPLPVIRSLRLPRRQKYTLVVVFGLGLITCVISVIRLRTLKDAAEATDPNWDNVNAAYWSFLEVCTAVLAASLPTLRPVLGRILPSVFGTRDQSNYGVPYHPSGSRAYAGRSGTRRTAKSGVAATSNSARTLDGDDVELLGRAGGGTGGYSVAVTGGRREGDAASTLGIKTTTVVTQQVEEGGKNGWRSGDSESF